MSLKAMTWVMEKSTVKAQYLPLLYALADRATDDGTAAWPSQEWLAERARCSVRTVRRQLQELEASGVIRRGDQRFVEHLRADRRPIVWDIVMLTGAFSRPDNLSPRDGHDRTFATSRPDIRDTHDRTLMSYKPSIEPSKEIIPPFNPPTPPVDDAETLEGDPQAGTPTHTVPTPAEKKTTKRETRHEAEKRLDQEFDHFWSLVALKRGKQQARRTFAKQRRTHSLDFICSQITKAQAEWLKAGRTPEYWPHPSTWLNTQLDDDYDAVAVPTSRDFFESQVQALQEQRQQQKQAAMLAISGGDPPPIFALVTSRNNDYEEFKP